MPVKSLSIMNNKYLIALLLVAGCIINTGCATILKGCVSVNEESALPLTSPKNTFYTNVCGLDVNATFFEDVITLTFENNSQDTRTICWPDIEIISNRGFLLNDVGNKTFSINTHQTPLSKSENNFLPRPQMLIHGMKVRTTINISNYHYSLFKRTIFSFRVPVIDNKTGQKQYLCLDVTTRTSE